MRSITKLLGGMIPCCLIWTCHADQFEIANFDEAQQIFWQQIHPDGGWTLYCGEKFNPDHINVQLDAIYSMDWVREHLGCGDVTTCRANSARFSRIEADLHNLYPVMAMTGNARRDYKFGQVDGEYRDFFECDFEVDGARKIVEPRQSANGNIARALLYMVDEYHLPLVAEQMSLMLRWNSEDPPSKDEKRRNNLIESLQGTRNRFIDNPSQANKF